MVSIISSKGQIVIPASIRQMDGIETGQEFELSRVKRGEYRLRRKVRRRNRGLVDHFLACPVKGFLQPVDSAETTADLKSVVFE